MYNAIHSLFYRTQTSKPSFRLIGNTPCLLKNKKSIIIYSQADLKCRLPEKLEKCTGFGKILYCGRKIVLRHSDLADTQITAAVIGF